VNENTSHGAVPQGTWGVFSLSNESVSRSFESLIVKSDLHGDALPAAVEGENARVSRVVAPLREA